MEADGCYSKQNYAYTGSSEEVARRINKFSLECEGREGLFAFLELQSWIFLFLVFPFVLFPFTSSSSVIYKIATFKSLSSDLWFHAAAAAAFFSHFLLCRGKKEDKNAMRNGAKLERAHILWTRWWWCVWFSMNRRIIFSQVVSIRASGCQRESFFY